MKLFFENAEKLTSAIELIKGDLRFDIASDAEQADIAVSVSETDKNTVKVCFKDGKASVVYGGGKTRFLRALTLIMQAVKEGKTSFEKEETPLFITNGAMLDCSRNAVMKVEWVKFFLRKMALMGMNALMLYTEDTYEVEERPYFGYMRGRYSKKEIREIDAYAQELGVELIPCIQMLGHLATYLHWPVAAPYKDTSSALMVNEEATYAFLEDLIKNIADCFSSRRLHIGMDETHDLGSGNSLEKNGFIPRKDLYFDHLHKVTKLVTSYGFKPMIWSDMFFRLAGKDIPNFRDFDPRVKMTPEIAALVPEEVQPVFWDYYNADYDFYKKNLEDHELFKGETVFAGGVWAWSSFSVLTTRYMTFSLPALDACRDQGTRECFATLWHNGSETMLIMTLAGLAVYASYDYNRGHDMEAVRSLWNTVSGENWDDFKAAEEIEYPGTDKLDGPVGRSLMYNDPLMGLMDAHVPENTMEYYKALTPAIPSGNTDDFAPVFDYIRAVSDVLENKADFGIRLKKAYEAGDKETMRTMAEECDVIIGKLTTLRAAHLKAWMKYNKPQGFEVHDIRWGGQLCRFATAKERILQYVNGEIEVMEELEEDRLRADGQPLDAPGRYGALWARWNAIATTNILH